MPWMILIGRSGPRAGKIKYLIMKTTEKLDDANPYKITESIWWIGFADYESGFSNNPYLIVEEDEAVLFDPGPGHPLFRDLIVQKIQQITDMTHIKYVVVHHQDPDLCGLIPFIETKLHPDVVIIAHPRTSLFVPYYGIRKGILPVGDGDVLEFKSGRRVAFYHLPYLHFAGNMVSFDEESSSLFSSDLFAVFDRNWNLHADESYVELARDFIEHYTVSKEALLFAHEKIKGLHVKRILPQHGGIIEANIDKFLDMLKDAEPGRLLRELKNRPSKEQINELIIAGGQWLSDWTKRDIRADSLEELMNMALQEGPSTVALILERIRARANELGVLNPIAGGRVHKWDDIRATGSLQFVDKIRKRYLARQYGLKYEEDLYRALDYGLLSFKTKVAIMFIDIRGFMKWSADRKPIEIMKKLSLQHELISKIINSNRGKVSQVSGDGIMAYFGGDSIDACVEVALMIHRAIDENNLLPTGVGCDFGEVVMGDLGQETRLDYTIIGTPTNCASRMCDSAGLGEVVISSSMFGCLSDPLKEKIRGMESFTKMNVKIKPGDPEVEAIKFSSD